MLDPKNMLQWFKKIGKGNGFWRDLRVRLTDFRAAAGTVLTGSGNQTIGVSSGVATVALASGAAGSILILLDLPLDYDSSLYNSEGRGGDALKFRIWATGGSTARVVTPSAKVVRPGDQTNAPTITLSTLSIAGATEASYDIDLSGNGLKPGDSIHLTLTGDTAAQAVSLTEVEAIYRSNLRATDDTRVG